MTTYRKSYMSFFKEPIIGPLFCIILPNCIDIGIPRMSSDVLSIFKMAVRGSTILLPVSDWVITQSMVEI